MKRKQLQALCKKHGIPANLSNSRMALLLSSTLKATEKPVSIVHKEGVENGIKDAPNKFKKVRFSPENETREYEPSVCRQKGRGRSLVSNKSPQVAENENEGGEKSSVNVGGDPPRTRRSRERKQVERDDESGVKAGAIGNKRGREVKIDSEVSVGEAVETGQGVRRSRRILGKHHGVEHSQQVDGMVARAGAGVAGNASEVENEVGDVEVVQEFEKAARDEKTFVSLAGRASRRKYIVPGNDKVEDDAQEARKETKKGSSRNSQVEIGFEPEASKESTVEVEKASVLVGNLRRSKRNTVMVSSSLAANELRRSEAVGRIGQLSEQASGEEVTNKNEGPRRSTRNASRCSSTSIPYEINETNNAAGKNERRKRNREPGSKKETSAVVGKRKLTRRSTLRASENVLAGSVPHGVIENEQHSTLKLPTITEDKFTDEAPVELPGNIMLQSTEDEDRFSLRNIEDVTETSNDNKETNGATSEITGPSLADISAVCSDVEEDAAIAHNLEETEASTSPKQLGASAAKEALGNAIEPAVLNEEEIIVMMEDNENSVLDAYDRPHWPGSCAGFDNDDSFEPELSEFQNETCDLAPPADKISTANSSDFSGEHFDISRLEKGLEREASSASNRISQKFNVATHDMIEVDRISAQKDGISFLQRTEQVTATDKPEDKEVPRGGSASRDVCAETVENTEASFMADEGAFSPSGDPANQVIEEKEDDVIDGKSEHIVITLQLKDADCSQIAASVSLQSPGCVCTLEKASDGTEQDDRELTEINSTSKDEEGLQDDMQTDVKSSLELQDEGSTKAGDISYNEVLCQTGFGDPIAQGVEVTFCSDGEAFKPSNEPRRSELLSVEHNHFSQKVTERNCSPDAAIELPISKSHHIVMDTVDNKCMDREQDLHTFKIETESGGAVEPEDKSYGPVESGGHFVINRSAEAEQSEFLTNYCHSGLGKLLEIEKQSAAVHKNINVNECIRLVSPKEKDNDKASPACKNLLSLCTGDLSAERTMQQQEAIQLQDQHISSVNDNYSIERVSPTSHEHENLILQTVEVVDDEFENIVIKNCSECEEKEVEEGTETASLHQPSPGKSKDKMEDGTRLSKSACDEVLSQKKFGYSVPERRERIMDSIHNSVGEAFSFEASVVQTCGELPSEKLHDDKDMVMEGNGNVGIVTDSPVSKVHVAAIDNVDAKGLREDSTAKWRKKEESEFPLNRDPEDLNDFLKVTGEEQNTDGSFTWTICEETEVYKERSGKRMAEHPSDFLAAMEMAAGETMEIESNGKQYDHAAGECTETLTSAVDLRGHSACNVAAKMTAASLIAVDQGSKFSEEKEFETREESSKVIKRIVVSGEGTASDVFFSKVDAFECCIGDYTGDKFDRKIHESNLCDDIYGNSEAAEQKTDISATSRLDIPGTQNGENLSRNISLVLCKVFSDNGSGSSEFSVDGLSVLPEAVNQACEYSYEALRGVADGVGQLEMKSNNADNLKELNVLELDKIVVNDSEKQISIGEKSADDKGNVSKIDGDLKHNGISTDAKDKEFNIAATPPFTANGNTETGFEERLPSNSDDDVIISDAFGNVKVDADEAGLVSTGGEICFENSEDHTKWQEMPTTFPLTHQNSGEQAKQNSSSGKKFPGKFDAGSTTPVSELNASHESECMPTEFHAEFPIFTDWKVNGQVAKSDGVLLEDNLSSKDSGKIVGAEENVVVGENFVGRLYENNLSENLPTVINEPVSDGGEMCCGFDYTSTSQGFIHQKTLKDKKDEKADSFVSAPERISIDTVANDALHQHTAEYSPGHLHKAYICYPAVTGKMDVQQEVGPGGTSFPVTPNKPVHVMAKTILQNKFSSRSGPTKDVTADVLFPENCAKLEIISCDAIITQQDVQVSHDNSEPQECNKDVSNDTDGKQTSYDKEINSAEASQLLKDCTVTTAETIVAQTATKGQTEVTDSSNIEDEVRYLQEVPSMKLFQREDTENELDCSDVKDVATSNHSSRENKIKSCTVEAEGVDYLHVLEDDVFSLDSEEETLEKLNVSSTFKNEMEVSCSVDSAAFPPQIQNNALELIVISRDDGNANTSDQYPTQISKGLNDDVGHQMEVEVSGTNHLDCVVGDESNIEKVEGIEERDKEVLPTVDDIQGSFDFVNLSDQHVHVEDFHISLEKVILTEAAEATTAPDAASLKKHSVEDDPGKPDAVTCFNTKDEGEAFELSSSTASSDASTEDQFSVTTNAGAGPEDERRRQQMFLSPNTTLQAKRKGGNSLYAKQWKSSMMKVKNGRTDLAIGTPLKALHSSEMKENGLSIKRAQIGGLTAPKVLSERRALEDLSNNHN